MRPNIIVVMAQHTDGWAQPIFETLNFTKTKRMTKRNVAETFLNVKENDSSILRPLRQLKKRN